MFGLGTIRSMNNVATIQALLRRQETFLYEVDEVVTAIAYEHGWSQSDQGEWTDEDGDRIDHPLDMFLSMQLSNDMEDEIVDQALAAYRREYIDTEDDE